MGATNKIQGTNIGITELTCSQCQQQFTQEDKEEQNWEVWWDTSNDVELKRLDYKDWYSLSIIIRSIEHEYCPDTERCQKCSQQFLVETMINPKGNFDYYCSPCYKQIKKEI